MEPLTQPVHGTLYQQGETTGLLLEEAPARFFLRFAFVVQGTERLIFPALVLDDWGRERSSLSLYRWVFQEGQRFPRAEVFGFTKSGRETQIFLRDLEIFFKYPCYVYPGPTTPLGAGLRLNVVFIPTEEKTVSPEISEVPEEVSWPLRHAAVSWRRATAAALTAAGWEIWNPTNDSPT